LNLIYRTVAVLSLCIAGLTGFTQDRDTLLITASDDNTTTTISVEDSIFIAEHSPRKASIYSAILPGLGQIYNRKYWKVPIVYAGLGGFTYGVIYNADKYKYYKDIYKHMLDNNLDEWEGYTKLQAETYKDFHRRYRDLFAIVTAGFYILQIVDANVDANLIDYDISEDLGMMINPVLIPSMGNNYSVGLRYCLNF
jgi:hypothetical protein